MKLRSFLFTALILLALQPASAQDKPKEDINFVSHGKTEFRGRYYEYYLDSNDLRDTPKWDPAAGEPPLSIAQAAKIARNNFGLFVSEPEGWEVSSIRLTTAGKHRWYYYITVSCMEPKCLNGSARGFHILVKLDGQIVLPRFTPPPEAEKQP